MRQRLRGLIMDQWLIVAVATFVIIGTAWLAFFAIQWRSVALQQQRSAEQMADWINDTLPNLLEKEK